MSTNEIYIKIMKELKKIENIWNELNHELEGKNIGIATKDLIDKFKIELQTIFNLSQDDTYEIFNKLHTLLELIDSISKLLAQLRPDTIHVFNEIIIRLENIINENKKYLDSKIAPKREISGYRNQEIDLLRIQKMKESINELSTNLDQHKTEFSTAINNTTEHIQTLEGIVKDELQPFQKLVNDANTYLEEKKGEIDRLLELTAGKVLAGSYSKHAKDEGLLAEAFRILAIISMLGITYLIGDTLYKSSKEEFDLSEALFRLALSLVLSVPAAYFARESSNHRQQKHLLLQTYLDLAAIDPYVAKMAEKDQYKIKALVANRIFSKATTSGNSNDSYPINVQQLIEKLIDTLDTKASDNKDK